MARSPSAAGFPSPSLCRSASSVSTSTTDQFASFRAGSGPAARYTVPIEFELVVEKGDKVSATAPSGPQEMTVRLHADNQKVDGGANPQRTAPRAGVVGLGEGERPRCIRATPVARAAGGELRTGDAGRDIG